MTLSGKGRGRGLKEAINKNAYYAICIINELIKVDVFAKTVMMRLLCDHFWVSVIRFYIVTDRRR